MSNPSEKKNPEKNSTPPDISIRCPRLGHQIDFSYCSKENSGLPCFKTLDCWHPYFNVHAFLKESLSDNDFKKVFLKPSKPKIFSLMDLIEQAKKTGNKTD